MGRYGRILDLGFIRVVFHPAGIISQVLDTVSNFRSYCEEVGINKTTCDIMQKELNEKYSSFRSSE